MEHCNRSWLHILLRNWKANYTIVSLLPWKQRKTKWIYRIHEMEVRPRLPIEVSVYCTEWSVTLTCARHWRLNHKRYPPPRLPLKAGTRRRRRRRARHWRLEDLLKLAAVIEDLPPLVTARRTRRRWSPPSLETWALLFWRSDFCFFVLFFYFLFFFVFFCFFVLF